MDTPVSFVFYGFQFWFEFSNKISIAGLGSLSPTSLLGFQVCPTTPGLHLYFEV